MPKKQEQEPMRAVIQRVSHASVTINGTLKSRINQGYLILLGICDEDTLEDVDWLVKKIANLRVFGDENDVMNRSILEVQGEALVVSQFTLYASYKKGNRPSWFRAGSMSTLSHSTRPSVPSCLRPLASLLAQANLAQI